MKSTEFTESKYLNAKTAGQLNGKTLTIFDVKAEMVGQDENQARKLIVGFESVDKGCIINRTNNEILTEAFGEETDTWIGRSVILHIIMTQFKGERKPGIQLEPLIRLKPGFLEAMVEEHTTSPPLGITDGDWENEHPAKKKMRK